MPRSLVFAVTVVALTAGVGHAQDSAAAHPAGASLVRMANITATSIRNDGDNRWTRVTGARVRMRMPAGANAAEVSFSANVSLRSIGTGDPHMAGYIRILEINSGTVVAVGRVFMGNLNAAGRVITVPVHIEGLYRVRAGDEAEFEVEVMARDFKTHLSIANDRTQGADFSPIVFKATAVRLQ